jgi:hypothetical protein
MVAPISVHPRRFRQCKRRDHQHIAAEQIGQMLTSAFANRLLAAAEEPPTA